MVLFGFGFCFRLTMYNSCYSAVMFIVIIVDFIRFVRVMLNFARSLSHLPILFIHAKYLFMRCVWHIFLSYIYIFVYVLLIHSH